MFRIARLFMVGFINDEVLRNYCFVNDDDMRRRLAHRRREIRHGQIRQVGGLHRFARPFAAALGAILETLKPVGHLAHHHF